jgi:predicted AlkP superfamily pyrophosphatase or phosphodiesterase
MWEDGFHFFYRLEPPTAIIDKTPLERKMIENPVVFILVDGMRPDGLLKAEAPVMKRLLEQGACTLKARTVFPSVTLPCITSIFLGVPPEIHGTIGNYWNSTDWQVPGLIDLFHSAGGRTAAFYNWEQLRDISHPGSLDVSICLNHAESPDLPLGESDVQVADSALSFLSSNMFDFTFIYLGCTDTAGHRHGWMSPEYLQAVENADRCIGKLVKALPAHSHLVIASDHGGHDHTHGSDEDTDMTVPLILHGEMVKARTLPPPVSVLDIAPTIASLAGLDIPNEWVGKHLLKP